MRDFHADVVRIWPFNGTSPDGGRFLIRLSENGYLDNRYAPENFEHMAGKVTSTICAPKVTIPGHLETMQNLA